MPSESRPAKVTLAPLIANPPTRPFTFLEGVEATAVGVAEAEVDALAEALAEAVALSAPATGVDEISDWASGAFVVSLPVMELKPRNAVTTNRSESATLEDFLATSAAFL